MVEEVGASEEEEGELVLEAWRSDEGAAGPRPPPQLPPPRREGARLEHATLSQLGPHGLQPRPGRRKPPQESSPPASPRLRPRPHPDPREAKRLQPRTRTRAAAAADARAAGAPSAEDGGRALEALIEQVLGARCPFKALGLEPGAGAAAVRKRYLGLALRLHPDKVDHPQAAEAFAALEQAYARAATRAQRRAAGGTS